MIRDFRDHGIEVYLTLALSDYEAGESAHPAHRCQLGHPDPPHNILPENWPWRPDHPDHQRFVAEFWETYTQQAVHFACIAEDEGARLYSLGTGLTGSFARDPETLITQMNAIGPIILDKNHSDGGQSTCCAQWLIDL